MDRLAGVEVLVLGGGVMGLAIAVALRSQGRSVSVVCRNFDEAAGYAAAGMLAPQAEGIPTGAMRDLCLRSRDLYPTWIPQLEDWAGCEAGYWPSGIFAPAYPFQDSSFQDLSDQNSSFQNQIYAQLPGIDQVWWDRSQFDALQTCCHSNLDVHLSPEVQGGWWFEADGQVDNVKLTFALGEAARRLGVQLRSGLTVTELKTQGDRVVGVMTQEGMLEAEHYVLATGAWSQELLPIPVTPRKGQMLSVRVPEPAELPLQTVLFGSEIYIVPRRDGRLVIGATVEDVGFHPGNDPAGVLKLLQAATRLVPAIAHYPMERFWYGYRPATPDECPILGESAYQNLTYATGHYRNGILLTPVTAQLIADWIIHQRLDPLLRSFHWSRFMA